MTRRPSWWVSVIQLSAVALFLPSLQAKDGAIVLRLGSTNTFLQVQGSANDDWILEASSNLLTWTELFNRVPLLGGDATNAPVRSVAGHDEPQRFFRARQTAGLYDPGLFRTVSLTFTQSNWGTLLSNARTRDTNIVCSLVALDNGATQRLVGARYKGNSSFTMAGTKKSINLDFDFVTTNADLMGFKTVNLNNAAGDESIMREALYFTVMSRYTPCPRGSMARVNINGSLWGVYSLIEQENADLVGRWFPSTSGDRWRAPNAAGGTGGFSSPNSAFYYFGNTNRSSYTPHYALKSDNSPTNVAFDRLIQAIRILNTTPTNQLRDAVEGVFAVDSWLWFLALENLFADDDSYWFKGADYGFYYEPESGRIHPIEHDGNEALTTAAGITFSLSPVQGATGSNRPLLFRLLPIGELRQRYLAHMRTAMEESFNTATLTPMLDRFHALAGPAIALDPNRGFTLATYSNEIRNLKTFITNRCNYLKSHAELAPLQPVILGVAGPATPVTAIDTPTLTARVAANGSSGLESVWLYHRGKSYGRFAVTRMLDDGVHGDGTAGDGVFGAATTNYPAGTKVRYYVEARGNNAAKAARFAPARAEQETFSYRVAITTAPSTPVILNEVMASNTTTVADPQGEFDDWIELHNPTDQPVDLTGRYLSDEPNHPRKWAFPIGTTIAPDGYLIVWADEDSLVTGTTTGLHASFKLASEGEEIYLADTDANHNAILDRIAFGPQPTDRSYGRSIADADVWKDMPPTPGAANKDN